MPNESKQPDPLPAGWAPRVGEMCEGEYREESGITVTRRGRFLEFGRARFTPKPGEWVTLDGGDNQSVTCQIVSRASLRPSPAPAPIPSSDRLFESGCCLCGYTNMLTILGTQRANKGALLCERHYAAPAEADAEITRRRALPKPAAPEESRAAPAPVAKADRYAAENKRQAHGLPFDLYDALGREARIDKWREGDALDKLAARKSRQVGALLEDMSRPISVKRHPSDYDVDDSPECYSTSSSRGGR